MSEGKGKKRGKSDDGNGGGSELAQSRMLPQEKYTIRLVHRSQLTNAPYNPRRISELAKRKLAQNIKRVGLVEPPVWNKRTGHIVSGHQRLDILDTLNQTQDYYLHVAEVDMDEKAEKEQVVFMNNTAAQGEYDIERLVEFFKTNQEIEIENTGYEYEHYIYLTGGDVVANEAEKIEELRKELHSMRDYHDRMDRLAKQCEDYSVDDPNYYCVVVFRDPDHRAEFLTMLGSHPNCTTLDGRTLMAKLESQ